MIFVLRFVSEIGLEWWGPGRYPYTRVHQFHRAGSCSCNALYWYSERTLFESNRDLTYLECFVWVFLVAPGKFRARLVVSSTTNTFKPMLYYCYYYYYYYYLLRVVRIATGLRTRRSGVESRQWQGTFHFFKTSRPALGQC